MRRSTEIRILFLDSGNVLLTNGWDLRKPDPSIFRLALNITQRPVQQVAFIDNTPMFVVIAEGLGIHGILHPSLETTHAALKAP